jgi:hypothetical protein
MSRQLGVKGVAGEMFGTPTGPVSHWRSQEEQFHFNLVAKIDRNRLYDEVLGVSKFCAEMDSFCSCWKKPILSASGEDVKRGCCFAHQQRLGIGRV